MNSQIVHLSVPAEAEYIDLVRLTLYGISSKIGFSYEEIEDMKVAVAEACSNAMVPAYSSEGAGVMEVRFERLEDGLRIAVKKREASCDRAETAREVASFSGKSLDGMHSGGLGIYLMQALMDRVEVVNGSGTEVILTKLLSKSEEMV